MNLSKNTLQKAAEQIVRRIRNTYINKDGVLTIGMNESGKILDTPIIDDFGDAAPFLALYGGEDICISHLQYFERKKEIHFEHPFAYTDLLLGLAWYSRISPEKERILLNAKKISDTAINTWVRKKKIRSYKLMGLLLPFSNTMDATFIEVWTELYRSTNDINYLNRAKETAVYYMSIQKKHGGLLPTVYADTALAPFFSIIFPKKFRSYTVMKNNTNYGFALLDLYRITKDITYKEHFDSLYMALLPYIESGNYNNLLDINKPAELLPSFATIDMLVDASVLFDDPQYAKSAMLLASFWLKKQSPVTGLIPRNATSKESYLDSETDFAISLLKLYHFSGKDIYKHAAKQILSGILKFHFHNEDYVLKINIDTKEIVSMCVKTKFSTLLIKLIHAFIDESSMYKKKSLFTLLKDR